MSYCSIRNFYSGRLEHFNLLSNCCSQVNSLVFKLQSLHFVTVITKPTRFLCSSMVPSPAASSPDQIEINCAQPVTSGILLLFIELPDDAIIWQLFAHTLSSRLAAQHCEASIVIYSSHLHHASGAQGSCHVKSGGNGQSFGSSVCDSIVRSWLWSTATLRSPLGYFSSITASSC